jgi:peptidyl-dipeptidase Dcp
MASSKGKASAGKRKAKPAAVNVKGKTTAAAKSKTRAAKKTGKNPLLERWTTPFEVPPFDRVRTEHFMPAFDRAFADNLKEIAAIAGNKAQPTFANTIDALERSGQTLDNVSAVFYNLAGTDSTPVSMP